MQLSALVYQYQQLTGVALDCVKYRIVLEEINKLCAGTKLVTIAASLQRDL